MELLDRKNWWLWLLIFLFGNKVAPFVLGAFLNVYDKNAWYAKWQNWLIGVLCCFLPAIIMMAILAIQITVQCAEKLEVPGYEVYGSVYIWILCLIIPFLGWAMLLVMSLYIDIYILVMLYRGAGEQYQR